VIELSTHEREPTAVSPLTKRCRQWFERDINESRPYSLALAVVPVIPGAIASEVGLDKLSTVLFVLGSPLAIGWFIYVLYRRFRAVARDTRRLFADHEAQKRGEELPTRCPECRFDLPEFQPPKDGIVYRFQGWNCDNCGTMLDELGHRI
jgi:hypothetical protein